MPKPVLFAGPTLADAPRRPLLSGITLLPPVRRGDVLKLLNERPGVLILADGVFRQHPAVGHAELLEAIRTGWQVWGVSSMGAIRAFEMRSLGMRGFGRVYSEFFQHTDLGDDELALLHSAEPPYHSFSEALVNLRLFLGEQVKKGAICAPVANQVVAQLKSRPFFDRTLALFAQFLTAEGVPNVRTMLAEYSMRKAKTLDLLEFLERQPWR